MGIDPGAHRSAAQRNLGQRLLNPAQPLDTVVRLAGKAQELLAQPDGSGVLKVGAAGLDHRPKLVGLLGQFRLELFQRRNQVPVNGYQRRQVDGGRNNVVG